MAVVNRFLHWALAWFRDHGAQVLRILTDNAKVYRVVVDGRQGAGEAFRRAA